MSDRQRIARALDCVIAESVATGMLVVLTELVTMLVLYEYRVVRFTPDKPCYCGDASCDRNMADSDDWTELHTLQRAYAHLRLRLAARVEGTE